MRLTVAEPPLIPQTPVVSAVLMLIFGAMGSEPITFKKEFAVTAHAFVPQLVGALVVVGQAKLTGLQVATVSINATF